MRFESMTRPRLMKSVRNPIAAHSAQCELESATATATLLGRISLASRWHLLHFNFKLKSVIRDAQVSVTFNYGVCQTLDTLTANKSQSTPRTTRKFSLAYFALHRLPRLFLACVKKKQQTLSVCLYIKRNHESLHTSIPHPRALRKAAGPGSCQLPRQDKPFRPTSSPDRTTRMAPPTRSSPPIRALSRSSHNLLEKRRVTIQLGGHSSGASNSTQCSLLRSGQKKTTTKSSLGTT